MPSPICTLCETHNATDNTGLCFGCVQPSRMRERFVNENLPRHPLRYLWQVYYWRRLAFWDLKKRFRRWAGLA